MGNVVIDGVQYSMGDLRQIIAENNRLRAELDQLFDIPIIREIDQMRDVTDVLNQHIAELEAENEALKAEVEQIPDRVMKNPVTIAILEDAERWRDLWELPPDRYQIVLMQIYNGVSPNAAIDAAMEGE